MGITKGIPESIALDTFTVKEQGGVYDKKQDALNADRYT
jgi:hypothetical protein